MKVISYLGTLPSKSLAHATTDNPKLTTLNKFVQGVQAAGDEGLASSAMQTQPSDVAVMLGWVHEHSKSAPHLRFRQEILRYQASMSARTVIADSNLFLYKDPANPYYYLRYSYDGVFPNTGEYCDSDPDPERWEIIRRHMGLDIRDWRSNGNHILICLQREGGWSMMGHAVLDWAMSTVQTIRQYSDRPIRIRRHPGDKKSGRYCNLIMDQLQHQGIKDVSLSSIEVPLVREFKHCWALVNHNSSPAVGAILEGIPVFVTDPVNSQAREVANTDLTTIEDPQMFDRVRWAQRLSQFHWSHDDLTSGRCWQHMRKWAKH